MKRCFFLFFFVLSLVGTAQDVRHSFNYENKELQIVLAALETAYNIKFSYNATSLKNIPITLEADNIDLQRLISKIEGLTNVLFTKIDERYYIVKRNDNVTVCGYLRNASDGSLVEGASIANKTKSQGTISNAEGFFKLEDTKVSDTLKISFIGFKTIVLPVKSLIDNRCETYTLTFENYVLNEVVVQEYMASGILKTRDGAIKINTNNLDILSGLSEPDILQNIQLLPGIESPSETASGLYIRGGSPDQNLILWDGIKMYNSNHFFGMISAFNPYITKDIKVYRSGAKSEYGDRVSGVIDIKTDNKVPSETQGGAGLNMTHADAFLKIPISKNFGLIVSGRRSITDIIRTPTFDSFSNKVFQNTSITENQQIFEPEFTDSREDFYFTDVTLKVITRLSQKDRITVSNLFTQNKLDYSFKDIEFDIDSRDGLRIKNFGTNTSWNRNWNHSFSSKIQLYYSEYDFDYTGENNYFEDDFSLSKKNNIKESGANLHTDWTLNNLLTFSNGYQFFSDQVSYAFDSSDFMESDGQNSPTHAIYSQLNYNKPNKWYLDVGLRANYYVSLNSVFMEPRIYAERLFNEHFRIKASAEIKNQAISQILEFETLDFGLENQIWALTKEEGFPLLKSNQFSAGFLFVKKGWNIDVDVYYKYIDGLTSLTRGFESAEDNFSEGSSTTKGLDILLKKKINNYSTWLGYTYSVTDFAFDDLNQGRPFKGNNDITHSVTWSHAYKWNNFQFSLGWKYRSGIPYSVALGTTTENEITFIDYDGINSGNLPDYQRMDFSALYEFKLSKKDSAPIGKFGFSLLNLYGRKNLLDKNFGLFSSVDDKNNQSLELREVNRFSLGTTPNIFFRVSF